MGEAGPYLVLALMALGLAAFEFGVLEPGGWFGYLWLLVAGIWFLTAINIYVMGEPDEILGEEEEWKEDNF